MRLILWFQQMRSISGANVQERPLKRTLVCLQCLHTFCPPVSHVFRICFSSVSLLQHMWLGSSPVPERSGTASLELSKVSEMARSSRTLINEQNMLLAAAGPPSPHERASSLIISGRSKRARYDRRAAREVSSWWRESAGPGSQRRPN